MQIFNLQLQFHNFVSAYAQIPLNPFPSFDLWTRICHILLCVWKFLLQDVKHTGVNEKHFHFHGKCPQ